MTQEQVLAVTPPYSVPTIDPVAFQVAELQSDFAADDTMTMARNGKTENSPNAVWGVSCTNPGQLKVISARRTNWIAAFGDAVLSALGGETLQSLAWRYERPLSGRPRQKGA